MEHIMKQTHRSLISALVLAGLLTPALILTGCESSGSAPAAAAQAAKANVGISVEFPASGAAAARIDDNATAVLVQVWDATARQCNDGGYCYYTGEPTKSVTLERPESGFGVVSASLIGVSPGESVVRVTQLSGTGDARTALETVNVSANLIEGQNNMAVSLIRAAWILDTAVTFNKIVSTDTTSVNSFSLVPYQYGYYAPQAAATDNVDVYGVMNIALVDQNFLNGASIYGTVLKGSNLCSYDGYDGYGGYGGYGGSITCGQAQLVSNFYQESGVAYFNRHDSQAAANSYALLAGSNDFPLANDSLERTRGWFAQSVGPDGKILELYSEDIGTETASDPSIWNDIKVAVTGGSTIQGNFIEWLSKSTTASNRTCYVWVYADNQSNKQNITCPATATAAKAGARHGKAFRQALIAKVAKAKSAVGKAAADAQGCYLNLTISYKDTNMYGGYDQTQMASWYYDEDISELNDVCRHPFTATASQLTSTDVDLVNQTQAVSARVAKR
jgi:hypothetical protein